MIFDFKQFKDLFINDTEENIQNLINTLLELEKNPSDMHFVSELMRFAHNIKGASASVGFKVIAQYAHAIEDVFAAISHQQLILNSTIIKTLFQAFDQLTIALKTVKDEDKEPEVIVLFDEIQKITHTVDTSPVNRPIEKQGMPLLHHDDSYKTVEISHYFTVQDSIKIPVRKLDTLLSLSSNLIENKTNLVKAIHTIFEVHKLGNVDLVEEAENFLRHLSSLSDKLQQEILLVRLVQLQTLFSVLPRMVRDIAEKQNKIIKLTIDGGDIELDRLIVNQLTSPLFHLVRNAVDHGILKEGAISIKADIGGELLTLVVEDNGGGINFDALFDVIEKKKIIESEQLAQIHKLIPIQPGPLPLPLRDLLCMPMVSTSQQVTEVSGRGVGLAGVKNAVESMGGYLEIRTQQQGTAFILTVPTNISLIKVVVGRVGNHLFGIPLNIVVECVPFEDSFLSEDKRSYLIGDNDLHFLSIEDTFSLKSEVNMPNIPLSKINPFARSLVIVQNNQNRSALKFDELLGEYEVVLKPIPAIAENKKFFSGAAVLYDGRIALIVDLKSFEEKGSF